MMGELEARQDRTFAGGIPSFMGVSKRAHEKKSQRHGVQIHKA
jgi:hypothetical protein